MESQPILRIAGRKRKFLGKKWLRECDTVTPGSLYATLRDSRQEDVGPVGARTKIWTRYLRWRRRRRSTSVVTRPAMWSAGSAGGMVSRLATRCRRPLWANTVPSSA
jgi:hypothetical protein